MEPLLLDLKYSLRQFRRTPLFVAAVVSTLALAIGANVLLFTIAYAALLRALPYPDWQRIVSISVARKGTDVARMEEPTARLAADLRLPVFQSLAMYNSAAGTLVGGEYPERVPGARVSKAYFDVLGVGPRLGRGFTDDELRSGGPAAIVLSDAVWTQTFGRRTSIVGERITLDDRAYEVVGVMPPGFRDPAGSEFWLPLLPRQITTGLYFIDCIARLQPSASVEQARAALVALRESRRQQLPAAALQSEIRVMSLHDRQYGDFTRPLALLLAIVGCVLLLACANIANLLLARSSSRTGELAVRLAVGASRGRLVQQLLLESVILACVGAVPGIALVFVGLRAFRAFGPRALATLPSLAVDNQVLLFTVVLTVGTGLIFGLAPAAAAARTNPEDGLRRRAGRALDTRWRPRRLLVALQIAAAVVLTLGAALLAKSFARFQAVDRGFNADNVLTASITLSTAQYPDAVARRTFFDSLADRVRGVPGVESVAISELGLSGMSMTMDWPPASQRRGETWEIVVVTGTGAGHFATFGIAVLQGRECADDRDGAAVLVNAAMARRIGGDQSALGQRLDLSNVGIGTREIIGVVADVPDIRTKAAPLPTLYACAGKDRAAFATLAVRGRRDTRAAALAAGVRSAMRSLDPAQPIARVTTVERMVREGLSSRWFDATVIAALATLALALALGGLYAVTAYSVAQRTREIGVRMALGADRWNVSALVLRQGGMLVLAGTALGLMAAIPLVRFVRAMLFDVRPLDPWVFGAVTVAVAVVAIVAILAPARRASRVDPMLALRAE
jgi:putative ABC transport system permease protein